MAIRAAVASTDGKVINQHFGKADFFLIFEFNDNEFRYIEKRKVEPCCHMGEHSGNAFENAAAALSDCALIIVSRIGAGAAEFLENHGFTVYESPFPIMKVLEMLKTEIKSEV